MKKILALIILTFSFILSVDENILAQNNESQLNTVKPALLVIDIQNEYLQYMSEDDMKFGMLAINGAIETFHKHNFPVIRIYHFNPEWGPKPGTEPFEYPKSVIINKSDPKIIKNYPSAFQKTELDKLLKENGCNTLYLCGLSSVGCVLATYFGSMERDYNVFMIKDGIISHNSNYTSMIKDICKSVDLETMIFMVDNLK